MMKMLQSTAAMACMKSLLMVFNFAFWLSGLAMLCSGLWMNLELHRYMQLSSDVSGSAPWVLAATGGFILITASLACCCTVKGQPALLYMYGGFLVLVLVMELFIAASTFALRDSLVQGFDRGLNQSIEHYKTGEKGGQSADFDAMQATLHCCGNHGFQDWGNMVPAIPVPPSCCKEPQCDTDNDDAIYTEGCYDKVVAFLGDNIGLLAGASLAVATFPLLGAIISCCLAKNAARARYEQMT